MKTYNFVREFRCLTDKCEDTCCKGWGMQIDTEHVELYKSSAPELLEFVTSGEADFIMKRDPETDFCMKYQEGLCAIHASKGEDFLGDACYSFPRIARKFGDETIMSAALSCPEITRLALLSQNPFELSDISQGRIPNDVKNYLPDGANSDKSLGLVNALIAMVLDKSLAPERAMSHLISICFSFKNIEESQWGEAIDLYIKMAQNRLLKPEKNPLDCYYILQTLGALIHASKKTKRPHLDAVFAMMQRAAGIEINKETLDIMQNVGQEDFADKMADKFTKLRDEKMDNILRNWLAAQISMASFPYSGFGGDIIERIITLSVRFATIRLALMSHIMLNDELPDDEQIVRIIQPIARFMDHLSEAELSLKIYEQAGWKNEPRLRAVIGDVA